MTERSILKELPYWEQLTEEGREITLFKLKEGDACIISAPAYFMESAWRWS